MAKHGKNRLPGFVNGENPVTDNNPFTGSLGLMYNMLNLSNGNWQSRTSMPGFGYENRSSLSGYPYMNIVAQDWNKTITDPNVNRVMYRVYDADQYGGRFYKPYDISSRFTPQGKFWDNLKFPTSAPN